MTIAAAYFTHVTEQGTSFEIPERWAPDPKQSACRSCSAPIVWCKTPAGKRAPVNPEGTSHFSTCPQADRWRRRKSEGAQSAPTEVAAVDAAAAGSEVASPSGPPKGRAQAAPRCVERCAPHSSASAPSYDPPTLDQAEDFARALSEELRDNGFAIHESRLCIRPGDPEKVGRPMTAEEARGLLGERQAADLARAES